MSAHESNYSHAQRLRATIFDMADGEQRRKAAIIEGRCPILTAFKTNSRLAAVTLRTCVGDRSISNGILAFDPVISRSNEINLTSPATAMDEQSGCYAARPESTPCGPIKEIFFVFGKLRSSDCVDHIGWTCSPQYK